MDGYEADARIFQFDDVISAPYGTAGAHRSIGHATQNGAWQYQLSDPETSGPSSAQLSLRRSLYHSTPTLRSARSVQLLADFILPRLRSDGQVILCDIEFSSGWLERESVESELCRRL